VVRSARRVMVATDGFSRMNVDHESEFEAPLSDRMIHDLKPPLWHSHQSNLHCCPPPRLQDRCFRRRHQQLVGFWIESEIRHYDAGFFDVFDVLHVALPSLLLPCHRYQHHCSPTLMEERYDLKTHPSLMLSMHVILASALQGSSAAGVIAVVVVAVSVAYLHCPLRSCCCYWRTDGRMPGGPVRHPWMHRSWRRQRRMGEDKMSWG